VKDKGASSLLNRLALFNYLIKASKEEKNHDHVPNKNHSDISDEE
jgi:hypothetical protein